MLNNGRFEDMTNVMKNDHARRSITIGNLMAGSHSTKEIQQNDNMADNCSVQDAIHS